MKKLSAAILVFILAVVLVPAALAASSPFADLPAGHWAYDAVAQLAADGIVSGYPDGMFKGAQPATRYEVASVVARALAKVDADKASQADLETLKKLTLEFRDELAVLGVRVDGLYKRTAALEENLGGWKLGGQFIFDANFTGEGWYNSNGADNEFDKNLFLLDLMKFIDRNTFFMGRFRSGFMDDGNGRGDSYMKMTLAFVETKLPHDVDLRVGRWFEDFELWNGLYWANYEMNSLFGSYRMDGFRLHKNWGQFDATAIAARNSRYDNMMLTILGGGNYIPTDTEYGDYMHYVLNLQWQPNAKFKLGGVGYIWNADGGNADRYDLGLSLYGLYADAALTPSVSLKGIYYWQQLDDGFKNLASVPLSKMKGVDDSSPNAWKLVLDVKQELLKFTSLWLEYSQIDNSFTLSNQQHVMNWTEREYTPSITDNRPYGWDGTTKVWMVGAEQRWNGKWTTFEKYEKADYGQDWADDAENFTLGVTYQYTPALAFQLVYDYIDYGDGVSDPLSTRSYRSGSDHVLKFRTSVNF